MTMPQAQGFAREMRALLQPGEDAVVFWLTDHCSRTLGCEVGHFRDLAYPDAQKIYLETKRSHTP